MSAADDAIHAIADAYWEARLELSPLEASILGYHQFDDRADDLSAGADQRRRDQWLELREQAAEVQADELDATSATSRQLLLDELHDEVRAIDLRLVELASDQMQGIHAELLVAASQLRAPQPEYARMAVARIPELARMLDQAVDRYRDGLAAGRSPVRPTIERSIHQVASYLRSPMESDPFVNLQGPDGWDGLPRWRDELAGAVRDTLRPAFERYLAAFRQDLLPAARPDDRPGLCYLADGEELYAALVEHHTGLGLTPRELHEAGLAEATGAIRAEFAQVGERVFGTAEVREIFDRLLNDRTLRYRDGDEILTHARACLDAANAALGDWFGLRPEAPCVLLPVPDYLAPDVPPAYYTPPAPDGSRPGEYHVNLHVPTERPRYATASIAFHEAVPGHHLQLAIATERPDLPEFRRMSVRHTAFVEGWALYTERLADEMGLYTDDLDRLGMLASDAWRACRLVVDTGLHAMGWSRQRAIDFMAEHVPLDLDTVTVEVDRYIGMPGQALAYKVGQREMVRLRDQAVEALGDRFDIRDFHDVVLGAATVSLPVLRSHVAAYLTRA